MQDGSSHFSQIAFEERKKEIFKWEIKITRVFIQTQTVQTVFRFSRKACLSYVIFEIRVRYLPRHLILHDSSLEKVTENER